jgi:hypothetical protein
MRAFIATLQSENVHDTYRHEALTATDIKDVDDKDHGVVMPPILDPDSGCDVFMHLAFLASNLDNVATADMKP